MDLDEFRDALLERRPMLEAWGEFVSDSLVSAFKAGGVSVQIQSMRPKDVDSAIGKLARKPYKDPLVEMTDLVGVRIVVPLSLELVRASEILESSTEWDYAKARDPEGEAQADPERFGYQSVHYELWPKHDRELGDVLVEKGTACEVQLRTLLQHAYAEVTHDHLYKSALAPPAKATRFMASSMALIETTDHLFCETMKLLDEERKNSSELLANLAELHAARVASGVRCDTKLNMAVLETFQEDIPNDLPRQIGSLLDENDYIVCRMRSRLRSDPFWSQPVALLAYWLVANDQLRADRWPFASSGDALRMVFSDLGRAAH